MNLDIEVSNPRKSTHLDGAWDVDVRLSGDIEERGEATLCWDEPNACYRAYGPSLDFGFSSHLVTFLCSLDRFDRALLLREIEYLAEEAIDWETSAHSSLEVQWPQA